MAIENIPNSITTTSSPSEESRLSGAYIRTLVKQLTTSKPLKNDTTHLVDQHYIHSNNTNKVLKGNKLGMAKPSSPQQQQQQQVGHKKQVRRRLHTSRPYQERLLNMAEARKEIVTALKFHRAAMKQANERQQQQHQHQPHLDIDITRKVKNEPCSPFATSTNVEVENFCYYPSYSNSNNSISYPNLGISSSHLIEPPPFYDTLNIPLPNQTLGLNLNLQAFTNLDTNFCHSNGSNPSSSIKYYNSCSSSMSPSSSSSSTPRELGVAAAKAAEGVGATSGDYTNDGLLGGMGMDMHPSLDEEEMAQIRSIGEQHQIEWDDTLNLVKSARWFKFLKNKEMKGEKESYDQYGDSYHVPYGEFMEFPPWLNANSDESFLQQHLDDSCSEDTTLPWVDIGDIDGMDDEWLS